MLAGHDANPENVPYPNPPEGYGSGKRNGATPGSVMRNFKFLGYLNADKSKGLQTIALADYYDPCSRRYAMLHLTVAGVWCQPCNQETDTIVANQYLAGERADPRRPVAGAQNGLGGRDPDGAAPNAGFPHRADG